MSREGEIGIRTVLSSVFALNQSLSTVEIESLIYPFGWARLLLRLRAVEPGIYS